MYMFTWGRLRAHLGYYTLAVCLPAIRLIRPPLSCMAFTQVANKQQTRMHFLAPGHCRLDDQLHCLRTGVSVSDPAVSHHHTCSSYSSCLPRYAPSPAARFHKQVLRLLDLQVIAALVRAAEPGTRGSQTIPGHIRAGHKTMSCRSLSWTSAREVARSSIVLRSGRRIERSDLNKSVLMGPLRCGSTPQSSATLALNQLCVCSVDL